MKGSWRSALLEGVGVLVGILVVFAEGPVTSDEILTMSRSLPGSFLELPERAALSVIDQLSAAVDEAS